MSPSVYSWWNYDWNKRLLVTLTEPIGMKRENEIVNINLAFGDLPINCTKELRIIADNGKEVPFQIYNETYRNGKCISVNIEFYTNISANSRKKYWIYWGNNNAEAPNYPSLFKVYGTPDISASNNFDLYYNGSIIPNIVDIKLNVTNNFNPYWSISSLSGILNTNTHGPAGFVDFKNSENVIDYSRSLPAMIALGDYFGYTDMGSFMHTSKPTYQLSCGPIFCELHLYGVMAYITDPSFSSHVVGDTISVVKIYTYKIEVTTIYDINVSFHEAGAYDGTYTPHYRGLTDEPWGTKVIPKIKINTTAEWIDTPCKDETHFKLTVNPPAAVVVPNAKIDSHQTLMIKDSNYTGNINFVCTRNLLYPQDSSVYTDFGVLNENATSPYSGTGVFRFVYVIRFDNNSTYNYTSGYEIETNPLIVNVGLEESYLPIRLSNLLLPPTIYINQSILINLSVYYNQTPLTILTKQNFQLSVNNRDLSITNFTNLSNGSYLLTTFIPYPILGMHDLKIKIKYQNLSTENSTKILISGPIKQKLIFITDTNWKNILSLTPLKKPVLISNEIDSSILHFLNTYKPEQIYLLGDIKGEINNFETYRISSYFDIPKLFFNTSKGIYAGEEKQKVSVASLIASLLNLPIVFNSSDALPDYNFSGNTTEEIENLYFKKIKEQNKNINYLILSDGYTPLDSIVASHKLGLIIQTSSKDPNKILKIVNETVKKLNLYNFYINHTSYILDGAYLLILGDIPPILKEDPVEKSWGLSDPLDGTNFITYLEYGDLNNDSYLDVAVGRLPNDNKIASLMFARTFLEDNKNALVASEYLHTNWLTILLYGGGGMWQGRTIAEILEKQSYSVSRLVERRSQDPREFLQQFTPENVTSFLDQAKKIGKTLGKYLGKTIGSLVSKVLIVLKGMQYVEQGLEMYLEYDWSSFGPKYERVLELIQSLEPNKLISFDTAVEIVNFLWPYPWKELNRTNLASELINKDIVYYEGIGNGSLWILPNPISMSGFLGWRQFLENRYNGSEVFLPEDIPPNNIKLLWDNSDLSAIGKMKDSFLEKGVAVFIGASAINYAPFSSEIDTRFFKNRRTIGTALIDAINEFRDDWLVWDPFSIIRPGIKAKTLREFILFGDPALQKDPIITKQNFTKSISCDSVCKLNISIPVSYSLVLGNNETTLIVDTENHLLEVSKPIIPLIEFEYFLPFTSNLIAPPIVSSSYKTFYNITLPKIDLLSHSLSNFTTVTYSTDYYPNETHRLWINNTIDNRTRIKLIHAAIQYNESNRTAIVFDTINFSMKYTSPLEFSILTSDISLNQNSTINITVWSNFSTSAILYLQISNSTHSTIMISNLTLTEGENNFNFTYRPENIGNFLVEGVLEVEDIRVGPRRSVFSVFDVIPPYWKNIRKFPIDINFSSPNRITIEAELEDNVGIDSVLIFYKLNETVENSTYSLKQMDYIGNNTYQVNLSFDWMKLAGKTFWFFMFANDTNGNANRTEEFGDYVEGYTKIASYQVFASGGNSVLKFLPNFTSRSNTLLGRFSSKVNEFEGSGVFRSFGFIPVEKEFCFLKFCRKLFLRQFVVINLKFDINDCVYFTDGKIHCLGISKVQINPKQEYVLDVVKVKIFDKLASVEGFKNFENIFSVTNMQARQLRVR